MTHTPGPWQVAADDLVIIGNPERGGFDDLAVVANCEPVDLCACPTDQQEANAKLIAAAPLLLETAIAFKSYLEDDSRSGWRRQACLASVQTIIAQATD